MIVVNGFTEEAGDSTGFTIQTVSEVKLQGVFTINALVHIEHKVQTI
jgi:hypothetical protein